MSWAPLADTLVDSSIWQEEDHVFRVFFAMLSLKGADDIVKYPNAYKLARRIHMDGSMDKVLDALKVLSSPDKRDPNQEFQGRRIEAVEDGWRILNAEKYRRRIALEMKRARDRRAQQAFRERKKGKSQPSPGEDEYVKAVESGNEKAAEEILERHIPKPINPIVGQALQIYEYYPLKVGKPKALKAIVGAIKKHGFEYVEAKTKEYAALRTCNKDFMPHPSTWFNQERYNDDPETWKANEKNTGTNQRRVDRNKGTLNEGTAHLYKAKPINPPS